jgi:hypothetical protein
MDENDIPMVLPESKSFGYQINDNTKEFIIALCALKVPHFSYKLFGIDTIFSLLSNKEKSNYLQKECNFTHRDFINLSGQMNISEE